MEEIGEPIAISNLKDPPLMVALLIITYVLSLSLWLPDLLGLHK